MNDEHKLTITTDGKTLEYDILFTFDSDETKKSYIIFTDNKVDDTGSIITYAATYKEFDGKLELHEIETEEEWNLIENILTKIEDNVNE